MSRRFSSRHSRELDQISSKNLPTEGLPDSAHGSTILAALTRFICVLPFLFNAALPIILLQKILCEVFITESLGNEVCSSFTQLVPTWLVVALSLEVCFNICMRMKLAYLDSIDPMEAALQAAPIMPMEERISLWDRVLEAEKDNVSLFFQRWFHNVDIDSITLHDLRNFIAWGFFDGRSQEHLLDREHEQIDKFVQEVLRKTNRGNGNGVSHRPSIIPLASLGNIKDELENSDGSESSQSTDDTLLASKAAPSSQIMKQLRGFRRLLEQLIPESHDLPAAVLAELMRKITECHNALNENGSNEEQDGVPPNTQRYLRPFSDPLLGVELFPLVLHILIVVPAEIMLRLVMWCLGFRRHVICATSYYYKPNNGKLGNDGEEDKTPIVFVHGIGLGVVMYLPLIWELLRTKRPIFLPEISTVSAFRPWVMPSSVQSPRQIAASLTAMLAHHGHHKATFQCHSYGSFIVSYVVKYTPSFVAALVFLDPVCFCLYNATLTNRLVYSLPHPGDISFMIRSDMMVKWAVQRQFCWARGNLFVDDIGKKPCVIFVSSKDHIAPSDIQESYLRAHGSSVRDFEDVKTNQLDDLGVFVFRGLDHGEWLMAPFLYCPKIVECTETLTARAEEQELLEVTRVEGPLKSYTRRSSWSKNSA